MTTRPVEEENFLLNTQPLIFYAFIQSRSAEIQDFRRTQS